jgi:hypothetical protein
VEHEDLLVRWAVAVVAPPSARRFSSPSQSLTADHKRDRTTNVSGQYS